MIRKLWNRWPIAFMPVFALLAVFSVLFFSSNITVAFVLLFVNFILAIGCFVRQAWLDEKHDLAGL